MDSAGHRASEHNFGVRETWFTLQVGQLSKCVSLSKLVETWILPLSDRNNDIRLPGLQSGMNAIFYVWEQSAWVEVGLHSLVGTLPVVSLP